MMLDSRAVARALGGEIVGGSVVARGPDIPAAIAVCR
jgi:hypothetical protein